MLESYKSKRVRQPPSFLCFKRTTIDNQNLSDIPRNFMGSALVSLGDLKVGDKFRIPSMSEDMREMEILEVEDDSVLVRGEKRSSRKKPWKITEEWFSNGLWVEIVSEADSK